MIHEETLIKAEGRIAGLQQELESIIQALEPLTGWKPRASLLAQCRLVSETLSSIAERMDRKLVVTIIGGVGIGKSTLFNAIAGMDDLSPTGHQRPTTRNFVVLCEQREDARFLIDDMGSETIRVVSGPDAHAFPNMILIDTPDTDSAENLRHHELIGQILHHTDVLLCGFSARNPKRRDHIDFMRPFVDAYPKDQLFVVLTECDRVLETELNDIIQDFRACLQTGWNKDVKRIFAVSARAFLKAPGWDETAMPLHPFNEYPALRSMLTDELNSPGAYISTRTKRCDHLMAFLRQQISASIRVPEIRACLESIETLNRQAIENAARAVHQQEALVPRWRAGLYAELAMRWWGPIGWGVAGIARTIRLGSLMTSLKRLARPAETGRNLFSRFRSGTDGPDTGAVYRRALEHYSRTFIEQWPPIAERLVAAGFSRNVREPEAGIALEAKQLARLLDERWRQAFNDEIRLSADRCSAGWAQLLSNMPVLAIVFFTFWRTVSDFFENRWLPAGYFLHAGIAIVLTWFVSFLATRLVIERTCVRNLPMKAGNRFLTSIAEPGTGLLPAGDVVHQMRALLDLSEGVGN